MNYDILYQYIEAYKNNFDHISKQELYKWKAIKHFNEHWDMNASDFSNMLAKSLKHTKNLLASGNYLARKMIKNTANHSPMIIRNAFKKLYDAETIEESDFEEFKRIVGSVTNQIDDAKNHYQDQRAFLVYLSLRFPERFFLYKFKMVKKAVERLEYPLEIKKGKWTNVRGYFHMCQEILPIIRQDNDLLRLHASRLDQDCYQDPEQHVLVQDIIYAIAVHLDKPEVRNADTLSRITIGKAFPDNIATEYNGRTVQLDFQELSLKRHKIGKSAELFVFNQELKKAQQIGKKNTVEFTSRDKGDGAGYDIKSVDENGNEIFIEVKATTSGLGTPFYFTRNELLCSEDNADKYLLYRVYNFNNQAKIGDIAVYKGSLKELCSQPSTYISKLKASPNFE